ncbi:hypothetical protein BDZ88DRAFT_469348, partial [Geranomyces variabilis]
PSHLPRSVKRQETRSSCSQEQDVDLVCFPFVRPNCSAPTRSLGRKAGQDAGYRRLDVWANPLATFAHPPAAKPKRSRLKSSSRLPSPFPRAVPALAPAPAPAPAAAALAMDEEMNRSLPSYTDATWSPTTTHPDWPWDNKPASASASAATASAAAASVAGASAAAASDDEDERWRHCWRRLGLSNFRKALLQIPKPRELEFMRRQDHRRGGVSDAAAPAATAAAAAASAAATGAAHGQQQQ